MSSLGHSIFFWQKSHVTSKLGQNLKINIKYPTFLVWLCSNHGNQGILLLSIYLVHLITSRGKKRSQLFILFYISHSATSQTFTVSDEKLNCHVQTHLHIQLISTSKLDKKHHLVLDKLLFKQVWTLEKSSPMELVGEL